MVSERDGRHLGLVGGRDFGVEELRAEPAGARRGGDGRWQGALVSAL